MIITQPAPDRISIKTKNTTVLFGKSVVINTYTVPGAGEYDVDGIQCEGQYMSEGLAYFVQIEEVMICYMTQLHSDVTKLDGVSDTAILVIDLRSDNTAAQIKPIIKALEPSYIFLLNAEGHPDLLQELNLPTEQPTSLKVTFSSLPQETNPTLILPA